MSLETPTLMATATTDRYGGLTAAAPIADIDARIRRVAGGDVLITDLAIDDIIDALLVIARHLPAGIEDLVDELADIIIDLDTKELDADDLDADDARCWCELYVARTPIPPTPSA